MTPQSPPHRARDRHLTARRGVTFLVAALAIGAVPLVARALDDQSATDLASRSDVPVSVSESTPDDVAQSIDRGQKPVFQTSAQVEAAESELVPEPVVQPAESEPVPEEVPLEELVPEPTVDLAVLVLSDTYEWGENSPRIAALQQVIGAEADGSYGPETAKAHRAALEFAGLPVDVVPVPVVTVPVVSSGPSAAAWAALRQCEAGGNYSITNPSGKYRGAYQFDRPTWDSVAGRHAPALVGVDPAAASPANQDAMAFALYSERGSNPWPQCGRHLR